MAGYVYAPDVELDEAELEAIASVARDLWEAWYTGDADTMQRCFHPDFYSHELVRKVIDSRTEFIATDSLPLTELVEMTGAGVGLADPGDREVQVTVLDATHHLASVKTVEANQTHFFHLIRFPEGWKIVQAIHTHNGGVIPNQTFDI